MTASALAIGLGLLPLAGMIASEMSSYSVIDVFEDSENGGGANPYGSLIVDPAGNLYGTAANGGGFHCGVVFGILSGSPTVLYTFHCGDGANPYGGLVRDVEGNLYGTTEYGGDGGPCSTLEPGCGLVFKLDPAGNETILHSFTGGADGSIPAAGLLRDPAGNLYGTTEYGGQFGEGVVFEMPRGVGYKVLHAFTDLNDGASPLASLIRDSAGNLYGTASSAGTGRHGVVFKLDAAGNETPLYSFTGGSDGNYPYGALTRDAAGNLYGTTFQGGDLSACPGGCGVIFKVEPAGGETVLYSFTDSSDGAYPMAGLVQDTQGNLYGTNTSGGAYVYYGVIFELTPAGAYKVLFNLNSLDGCLPHATLLAYQGYLYGTNSSCGEGYVGTAFKLSLH
jgi:uncharacterized repeat protein (TIGR03803 family)